MPGSARSGVWPKKPDEHRPAGRIANIANRPVPAPAPPIGQVMAADRLGVTGKAARQFGSVARHHATPASALELCCVEAADRPQDSIQPQVRNIILGATYSVHFPAAPLPESGPFSRTNSDRPGVFLTSPTSQ